VKDRTTIQVWFTGHHRPPTLA